MPSTPKISSEKAAAIMREVQPNEAFYFYRSIDNPLPVSARSLQVFADRLKTVDVESLNFHIGRQDFEKWITLLGDTDLSGKVGTIRKANLRGDQLRTRLYSTVRSRVDQLTRVGMRIPR